jgi:hypothetical protein
MTWESVVDKWLLGRGEGRSLSLGTRRLGGSGRGLAYEGCKLKERRRTL